MKILLTSIFVLTGIFIVTEIALRLSLGFGNPPLYIADDAIGYLLAPNQNVRRRGNKIKINQFSMRSDEIAVKKPSATTRVMLLGDSIVNGGWWTDQQYILSKLIETELKKDFKVEVFNASANSWSPRNELAYLQRFGLFEADFLVLVINTDDLFGTAPTSVVVGKDPSYQDTKPALALIELANKYLKKTDNIPELQQIQSEKGDRVGFNLEAISQIKAIADSNNTRFILAFTPLLREIKQGSRDYELVARKRVKDLVHEEDITYINFLDPFAKFPQPEFLYRDHIHLSPQGETMVSQRLTEAIEEKLKNKE